MASAIDLPFRDKKFDSIVCIEVIEYVRFYRKVLHQIGKTLKDYGIFVLSTPNKKDWIIQLLKFKTECPFHAQEFTVKEMKNLLKQHGFQINKTIGLWLRIPIPMKAIRNFPLYTYPVIYVGKFALTCVTDNFTYAKRLWRRYASGLLKEICGIRVGI